MGLIDPGAETPRFPLFVPADRPDVFAAACEAGADAVVIDLEDSVAPESKAAVRRIPTGALPERRAARLYLRVNGTGTPWHRDDVAFARMSGVDGVVLPKVESAEQVARLRAELGQRQRIVALIETVRGLSCVEEIAQAADRLAFGSIDLSEDMGCAHTRLALLPIRSRIVQAARLAGRPAPLDGVSISADDAAAVTDDALHASELGFGGKCLIHPRQIAPARAGFGTAPQDLDWIRHIGAIDGGAPAELVQSPVAVRARRLLARDRAETSKPAASSQTPPSTGK
ncbi:HpcH/HpaI aldolase/citrate lyase family protein [Limimaricola litoreus]